MSNDPYGVIKISLLEKRVEELEAELSARREVDEWLKADFTRSIFVSSGVLIAMRTVYRGDDEPDRVNVARGRDYPSLAAALRGVK